MSHYRDSLSKDSQDRYDRGSILRILESKDNADQDILKEAPSIRQFLSDESKQVIVFVTSLFQQFVALLKLLDEFSIPYCIDDHLVRGLDYYDNIVFEYKAENDTLIVLLLVLCFV